MGIEKSNALRVLSILAVLVIHSTYSGQFNFSRTQEFLSSDFIFVVLNQMARFSVPVFIILSGYGLTAKYNQNLSIKEFYYKRFLRIGIPFLFWTFLLLLIQQKFIINFEFLKKLFYYLTITGIDYHLYFLIIIIQCYLIFPLLVKIHSLSLFVILMIVQLYNYSPTNLFFQLFNFQYYSFPSTFLFSWLFYFYLGIFIKQKEILSGQKNILKELTGKWQWLLFVFLIFSLVLVIVEYIFKSFSEPNFSLYDHFHRYTVFLYSICFFLFYYNISVYDFFNQNYSSFIQLLSEVSFSVYLFHTWILRGIEMYINSLIALKFLLLVFFSFSLFILIKKIFRILEIKFKFNKFSHFLSLLLGL